MFCFNPSLWPSVQRYKKREAGLSLALSLSQFTPTPLNICGNLLLRLVPNTGRPICISIGMVKGYWFLLLGTCCGYPKAPSTPLLIFWQLICLPSLHLLSLVLRRGFRRTPTNHTMRLTWTLRHYDLLRFLSLLPSLCLRGLFPPSDLWYSHLARRHISRLRPVTLRLTHIP